jgi:hypothetical protein
MLGDRRLRRISQRAGTEPDGGTPCPNRCLTVWAQSQDGRHNEEKGETTKNEKNQVYDRNSVSCRNFGSFSGG